jgi:tetratricopeptide (TPR) repeat protein
MTGQLIAAHALEREAGHDHAGHDHAGPDPAAAEAVAAGLAEVSALAERHGQRYHLGRCHDLLARVSALRGDRDAMATHLQAAREAFLAQDQPWFAAYPELALAEHALQAGHADAAEQLARDALAHGTGELAAVPVARASSLLVAALGAQEGREADLADAALAAAARWDGISEPDALHATFTAARAYASLGRPGEAAGLFAQAIEKVDVPYDGPMIAMTRDTYGRSLSELGQHEEAAAQFLEAARLLQDDPANTRPHALLAALAAEELQRAGQYQAALPAFLRAADLLGALGAVTRRARCLRSAAWLEYNADDVKPTSDTPRPCVTRMQSVQAELEAAVAEAPPEVAADISGELAETRRQLEAMLTGPDDWDDEEYSAES